jgi:hypothetical protein
LDAIAAPETVPTPAATPVLTAQEIEALIERKAQEISDRRVSGLMSNYDKKLADSNRELSRIRQQLLPDEEPMGGRGEDPEKAALVREVAILRAAQRYPKAAPVYQRLMEIEDTEEQIALLEELFAPPAPAPAPPPVEASPEPDVPTAPVDANRPANLPNGGVVPTPDGGRFSDAEAARYLDILQGEWDRQHG